MHKGCSQGIKMCLLCACAITVRAGQYSDAATDIAVAQPLAHSVWSCAAVQVRPVGTAGYMPGSPVLSQSRLKLLPYALSPDLLITS